MDRDAVLWGVGGGLSVLVLVRGYDLFSEGRIGAFVAVGVAIGVAVLAAVLTGRVQR